MFPLIIDPTFFETGQVLKKLAAKYKIEDHNILKIMPLREEITINQIRELTKDLAIAQTKKRMIIFFDFDKSGLETQNSLLKILEEKVEQNLFIFLARNSERIIPTIKSRAKTLIHRYKKDDKADPLTDKIIESLKKTKNLSFLNKKELTITTKESFIEQSNKLISYFQKKLREDNQDKPRIIKIIKRILQLIPLVENNNLHPQLSFDNLLIFIWKNYSIKM